MLYQIDEKKLLLDLANFLACFISYESQLIEKRRVEFILSPWYSINVIYVSDFTLWHVNSLALNLIVEKRNQFFPWLRSSDYESSFLVSHYHTTKWPRISVGGMLLIWTVTQLFKIMYDFSIMSIILEL